MRSSDDYPFPEQKVQLHCAAGCTSASGMKYCQPLQEELFRGLYANLDQVFVFEQQKSGIFVLCLE